LAAQPQVRDKLVNVFFFLKNIIHLLFYESVSIVIFLNKWIVMGIRYERITLKTRLNAADSFVSRAHRNSKSACAVSSGRASRISRAAASAASPVWSEQSFIKAF
jgi:hypothetical protein